jgi:hypothetical protein
MKIPATRAYLVKRQGLVFLDDAALGSSTPDGESRARALGLELAGLGFVPTQKLTDAFARLAAPVAAEQHRWICEMHAELTGANRDWTPLFYSFPDDIPTDMHDWWWDRVIVHYLQGANQPCLRCQAIGSTHVVDPCGHIVCDRCWDGTNFTACPICGGKLVAGSPFLQPKPAKALGAERFPLRLLDLGDSLEDAVRTQFLAFCARKQAMSPDDVGGLRALVTEIGARVLAWLPDDPKGILVRENVAHIFGTLFKLLPADVVLPVASRYLKSATDVLRMLAAASGAEASLQAVATHVTISKGDRRRWDSRLFKQQRAMPWNKDGAMWTTIQQRRFKVAKLKRPTRRAILGLLDAFVPDSLAEDMLRHRSAWTGVGEMLHPHEYADRFPNVARAFRIVRGQGPDGAPAPAFLTYAARVSRAFDAKDPEAVIELLRTRPGEFARRYDHLLRIATKPKPLSTAMAAFAELAPKMSTVVLLTLRHVLPTRRAVAPVRVYWPKGTTTRGYHVKDTRDPLPADVIAKARRAIDAELLARFAALPAFEHGVLDQALREIVVPFNERTASRAAIQVPRGSKLTLPEGKHVRLFLHWCQPEKGTRTDIDLSVGFYDPAWKHAGTCSYYQLSFDAGGKRIATSSGDFTSAPHPDGASEFVDVDRAAATAAGIRFAVMVVNAYAGLTFSQLERGFAGLMLRDSLEAAHFDPRAVELKFDLQGEHGVFMPLVIDLETDTIHWLDVYDEGQLQMNNVKTSMRAITTICPNLITYFDTGIRPSMYDLVAIHLAARTQHVTVRKLDGSLVTIARGTDTVANYLARIQYGDGTRTKQLPDGPVLAALHRGTVPFAQGSTVYALIREHAGAFVAASSFIA